MLPPLRTSLDFMPSPLEDQPGLMIRDPFHYSDATLVVPPQLVPSLMLFDGKHSHADLCDHLRELTGEADTAGLAEHLEDTLSGAGFLDNEAFAERRDAAEKSFAAASLRAPAHAGSGYPEQSSELSSTFNQYLGRNGTETSPDTGSFEPAPIAIAAPHVSPFGGIESYRAAYRALSPADAERTFIILGTSHYGAPDRFGLTRKAFQTPLGQTTPALDLMDELEAEAGAAIHMEDYCHAVEHSIEFQVVFLQHLLGPRIRVLPVLCGAFWESGARGRPEDRESTRRMFDSLGEIAAREGDRLRWVLGIDMAHIGRRYGDGFDATADSGPMLEVAARDRERIAAMEQGQADRFWDQVQSRQDRDQQDVLKWCGSAPVYTFLKAVPGARGSLLHYQQWNIDPASVVSFAGMRFATS